MADRHERANGSAYREHEIALPGELTQPQLVELAERLAQRLAGSKPYQYAIHAPEGALGGIEKRIAPLITEENIWDNGKSGFRY
ncbi:hypothetical protein [Stenotrophomonas sp. MH181796]|uniref:hypothetical protein n=1 Tax=Stenotrophomonas sp. MH181796 TaxID=2339228 RepID=UPI0018921B30|nr:hypothetical protein [Stenotrophomonas sp. MH181796]